jgi:hypothetical protein
VLRARGCARGRLASVSVDEMIRRAGQRISTEHGEVEIAMLPTLELCVQWVLGSGTQPE